MVSGNGWLQAKMKEHVVSSHAQVLVNAEEARTPGKGQR